jgi:hypothetical protein
MNQDITLYVDVIRDGDEGIITIFVNNTREHKEYAQLNSQFRGDAYALIDFMLKAVSKFKPHAVVLDVPSDFRYLVLHERNLFPRGMHLYELRAL